MTETLFPFNAVDLPGPRLGLIALQSDETIEGDLRALLPTRVECLVSRVPSGAEVSSDTLSAMQHGLSNAAALFPAGLEFDVIGYGCTSGTAEIGADRVAAKIRDGTSTVSVTDPLTALTEACRFFGLTRIALLSPYVAEVSARLREELARRGVETPLLGSFNVATEAVVARISAASVMAAARDLMASSDVEGLFLSCTNLRALDVIAPLEQTLGKPVLSSNQVLAWHMMRLGGLAPSQTAPGRLMHAF